VIRCAIASRRASSHSSGVVAWAAAVEADDVEGEWPQDGMLLGVDLELGHFP
jgi:hypothetical protein